jgi:hypothetical protein
MASPQVTLDQLSDAARHALPVSMFWHIALTVALVSLALGWRPSRRLAGCLLSLPLGSTSLVALAFGHWMDAVVLGVVGLVLLGLGALRLSDARCTLGSVPICILGFGLVELGWIYPLFLRGEPASYLIAAPLGTLPCPTLASIVGLALLAHGLGDRAWATVLGLIGLFCGLFSSVYLGVALDTALSIGSLALLGVAWSRDYAKRHRPLPA